MICIFQLSISVLWREKLWVKLKLLQRHLLIRPEEKIFMDLTGTQRTPKKWKLSDAKLASFITDVWDFKNINFKYRKFCSRMNNFRYFKLKLKFSFTISCPEPEQLEWIIIVIKYKGQNLGTIKCIINIVVSKNFIKFRCIIKLY